MRLSWTLMRIAAMVVLALLGACGGTEGLQIVIEPPPPGATQPDRVRLYIGVPTEAEGSIAPPGLDARYGNYWMRDAKNLDDVVEITPPNAATFVFEDDLGLGEYGAVIAVGLTRDPSGTEKITSTATLFHVRMGVGQVHVYRAQLTPSVPADDNLDAPTQHTVWGGDRGDACIHVVNRASTDTTHHHRTASVVTRGDRDCDGLADDDALECERTAYLGTRVPDHEDDLSCLSGGDNMQPHCTLGALPCIDGEGEVPGTCAASPYCAPPTLCRECAAPADPWECARDAFTHAAGAALHLKCRVHAYLVSETPPRYGLCDSTMTFPPSPVLELPLDVECEEAIVTWPGADGFESSYAQPGFAIDIDTTPRCGLTVRASGTYEGAIPAAFPALIGARLTNGRGWALPLRIELAPTDTTSDPAACSNYPITCELVEDLSVDVASMRTCMGLPVSSP